MHLLPIHAAVCAMLSASVLAEQGSPLFPPVTEILGERATPLPSAEADDLRDAVGEQPSFESQLRALRSGDSRAQRTALEQLSDARAPHSAAYASAILLRVNASPESRVAAATALGRIGFAGSVKALEVGLQDPDTSVRFASALAVGHLAGDDSVRLLVTVLLHDAHWWVRYAAAVGLGTLKSAWAVPALSRALYEEQRWQVRQQAARALGEIATPAAAQALARALDDEEPVVRYTAARALASAARPESFELLYRAYGEEKDPQIRRRLRVALGRCAQ